MYWQTVKFRSGKTFDSGGTYRLTLPDHGLLGSILFHVYGTPVANAWMDIEKWRLIDYLNELKIVRNGSTVIKALSAPVNHYMTWLDGGQLASDRWHNYATETMRYHGLVNFGHRLYDLDYGLDLSREESVEIQFSNNLTAALLTGNLNIDIIMFMLRDAPAGQFKGFFRTEEWRNLTTIADEEVYLELPSEGDLRRLVVQTMSDVDADMNSETNPYNVAYNLTLTKRSGVDTLFEAGLRDLWYQNFYEFGRSPLQCLAAYHSDNKGIYTGFGQELAVGASHLSYAAAQIAGGPTISASDDGQTIRRYTDVSIEPDGMIVTGLSPENCAVFSFDQAKDPSQYLSLKNEATVQLDVKTRNAASAADGEIRVVLDRLMRQ
jgi:hypothetical protein